MGCNASRQVAASASYASFQFVDDSVHVMIEHSKKVSIRHGVKPSGYLSRPEHPLLISLGALVTEDGRTGVGEISRQDSATL